MITASDLSSLGFSERELRRHFPPMVSAIADVIGMEATITLLLHFGGTMVYVPQRMNEKRRIAQVIGLEPAKQLSVIHGGAHLTLPNLLNGTVLRQALAMKLVRDGHSISEVAQATGVSRSTVIEWKKRHLRDDERATLAKERRDIAFEAASKPVERVISLSPNQEPSS